MLKIDKDWRIVTDGYCLTLQKRRKVTKKTSKNYGKFQWDIVGYYGKLRHALERYSEDVVRGSHSFEDAVARLDKVYVLLKKICGNFDKKLLGNKEKSYLDK